MKYDVSRSLLFDLLMVAISVALCKKLRFEVMTFAFCDLPFIAFHFHRNIISNATAPSYKIYEDLKLQIKPHFFHL